MRAALRAYPRSDAAVFDFCVFISATRAQLRRRKEPVNLDNGSAVPLCFVLETAVEFSHRCVPYEKSERELLGNELPRLPAANLKNQSGIQKGLCLIGPRSGTHLVTTPRILDAGSLSSPSEIHLYAVVSPS